MVQSTYKSIGVIVDTPRELMEYDVWDVYEDEADGQPIAFRLSKTTPFGIKGGLSGSDGSRPGRRAIKDYVATWFNDLGHYSEVSHRMLELAVENRAPAVCAEFASRVLNKPVVPTGDGISYQRMIKNVGMVTKVIVGRPYGIPTTPVHKPDCPVTQLRGPRRLSMDRDATSLLDHAAALIGV